MAHTGRLLSKHKHGARRSLASLRCTAGACAVPAPTASGGIALSGCPVDTFVKTALASLWRKVPTGQQSEAILVPWRTAARAWRLLRADSAAWFRGEQPDYLADAVAQGQRPGDWGPLTTPATLPGRHAWDSSEAFRLSLTWFRIEVFRRLQPPWFRLVYSPDGCDILQCQCEELAARSVQTGFRTAAGAGTACGGRGPGEGLRATG
jgi:hypothetical protein